MNDKAKSAVDVTRDYYNSHDADNFYFTIWGGEDLHLGVYEKEDDSIFDASRRTIDLMAAKSKKLGKGTRVLDVGAGFGGTARYLAKTRGCRVTCLNLSEVENERNRKMNADQGLDSLIDVVDGNFEELPFEDGSFDVVWSQDAILHSGDRNKVLAETSRVLASGGEFIFTDPMQADEVPVGVLEPIYERIHLTSLGSVAFYTEAAKDAGFARVAFEDQTPNLIRHYARVLEETLKNEEELHKVCSDDYISRMKKGLALWVDGGKKGWLRWGIFSLSK